METAALCAAILQALTGPICLEWIMKKIALNIPEDAEAIGVLESKMKDPLYERLIPSFKIDRLRRVSVEALEEWVREQ